MNGVELAASMRHTARSLADRANALRKGLDVLTDDDLDIVSVRGIEFAVAAVHIDAQNLLASMNELLRWSDGRYWRQPGTNLPGLLRLVDFDPPADDEEYEPWFPESPDQREPRRMQVVTPDTSTVLADFVVHPLAPWDAWDAAQDQLIREGWTPPAPTDEELAECVHGMSAQLCAGPGHYPPDR